MGDFPAAVAAMMAADDASRALGIEVVDCGPGRATARMTIRPDMLNGHALAHGGLVFALADTAFACACNSHGPVTVAAAAEIVFVRSARLGDVLVAEARERTLFGRSGIYDVTVRRADAADSADSPDSPDSADGADSDVIAEFRGRSHRPATR